MLDSLFRNCVSACVESSCVYACLESYSKRVSLNFNSFMCSYVSISLGCRSKGLRLKVNSSMESRDSLVLSAGLTFLRVFTHDITKLISYIGPTWEW